MIEDLGISADTRAKGVARIRNAGRILDIFKLDNAA